MYRILKALQALLSIVLVISCNDDMMKESDRRIIVRTEVENKVKAGYEGTTSLPSEFIMDIIQGDNKKYDYSLIKMTKGEIGTEYNAPEDILLLWADEHHENAYVKAITVPYGIDSIDPDNPMEISVCQDQTTEENIKKSDVLYASTDNGIKIEGDDINITFNHMMSKLQITYNIKNGSDKAIIINSLSLENICTKGGFSYNGMNYSSNIALGYGNIAMYHDNGTNTAEALFYPYIPSENPVLVINATINGTEKELICPVSLKGEGGFKGGSRYKMNVEITGSTISNTSINIVKDWNSENDEIETLIGEKILWIGTSIPSGDNPDNNYPKLVAEQLGCTIINNARPSSFVAWDPACNWTTSTDVETYFPGGYCLSATHEEIIEKYSGPLENIRSKEGKTQEWVDYWMNEFLRHSYETLIIPYIDGTLDNCTTIILDHGYNDRHTIVFECLQHWATKKENDVLLPAEDIIGYTWLKSMAENKITLEEYLEDCKGRGFEKNSYLYAMSYVIQKCMEINPDIRIIIGNYFAWKTPVFESEFAGIAGELGEDSNDFCSLLCAANEAVAGIWNADIVNVYKYTWIMNVMIDNMNDYMKFCPDGTHPHSDPTGESNRIIADIYVKELKRIFGI